jgi:hypothetical protein
MLQTKEERIAYIEKRLSTAKKDYSKCKTYFRDKKMPDEESEQEPYCGYFKDLIDHWNKKLEDEKREGN